MERNARTSRTALMHNTIHTIVELGASTKHGLVSILLFKGENHQNQKFVFHIGKGTFENIEKKKKVVLEIIR